ncbi:helix-turn-helix domain-containing protein [Dyadobacter jejuensis]|nr:helix-turn-helix domain-containing protein [Dyadobacter jejuensis]
MDQKIYVFRNEGEGYETFLLSINVILSLSGLTYIYITNKLLLKHRHRILQEFSYKEKINLDWLQFLFFGMGLIWISIILNLSDNWIFTLATLFVIFIGYFGISQSNIFNYQQPENIGSESEIILDDQGDGLDTKRKYAKSGLTKSSSEDLHHRLTLLMRQHRLYREPGLTLVELANRLDIHPNYLSQVINEIEKNNFYDYINGLRIEEFKKEIIKAENKKYTLIYVAFDCGFNSKSAFNRYFKKIEGQSPTEFLKSYENENL